MARQRWCVLTSSLAVLALRCRCYAVPVPVDLPVKQSLMHDWHLAVLLWVNLPWHGGH